MINITNCEVCHEVMTLLQEYVDSTTNSKELQVIAFVSTKFSGSAAL
jgi:hypothetical protein